MMGNKTRAEASYGVGARAPFRTNSQQSDQKYMNIKHSLNLALRAVRCVLAGWALACPLANQAAVTNVSVEDDFFNPAAVTINAGDKVLWTWSGFNPHSSTSDTSIWDSGVHGNGFTFTNTFPTAGGFPYFCVVHGFTGNVTVQAVNVPPSVSITAPTNGAVFAAPWTGLIAATASDSDGTVSKVDFFAGATRLGTVTNPPANPSFTVTNLAAGNYTLTAVATDNGGATNTSTGVGISVVTPVAIVLSAPQRLSATAFQFNYSANTGLTYIVFRSGALPAFSPVSTNTANTNTVTFLDNGATGAVNFYGVHRVPNP
jgi:plastocyanin